MVPTNKNKYTNIHIQIHKYSVTRLRVADEERVDCNPTLMTTRQITTALPWHQHQGISIISHNLQLLIIININHFSQSIPIIANAISIPIYSNALFKHKRQGSSFTEDPTQTHQPRVIVQVQVDREELQPDICCTAAAIQTKIKPNQIMCGPSGVDR